MRHTPLVSLRPRRAFAPRAKRSRTARGRPLPPGPPRSADGPRSGGGFPRFGLRLLRLLRGFHAAGASPPAPWRWPRWAAALSAPCAALRRGGWPPSVAVARYLASRTRYSAPCHPPLVLMARVRRPAAALAFTPLLTALRHPPRCLAAFPSAAGASRGLPYGVEPPPPPAGRDGGLQLPRWTCVIWPGRSRVHHPIAVPNWRLYSAYLGRPCGGSATSWFGAGLFCFNRLGPWN